MIFLGAKFFLGLLIRLFVSCGSLLLLAGIVAIFTSTPKPR